MASVVDRPRRPLGLIAGQGRYPLALVQEARRQAQAISLVALPGLTLSGVAQQATTHHWLPLGQLRAAARFLKATGVQRLLLAGAIPPLHQVLRVRPDRLALSLLWQRAWVGDDGLLRALAHTLATFDLLVVPPGALAGRLLAPEGRLAGPPLSGHQRALAHRAVTLARHAGRQDRGQGAVVGTQGALLEDRWGTDRLLQRAGRRGWQGAVLAKVAKPQQDLRFDLPTIGPTTVAAAARAGLSAVVVQARAALLLDRRETTSLADRWGLSLWGWPHGQVSTADLGEATLEHQTR